MSEDQYAARPVTDRDLVSWSNWADLQASRGRPGGVNWAMMVRSLIAEVRRLRAEIGKWE